jgi:rare lipoprotein A (peptidoglycan hydrolase)
MTSNKLNVRTRSSAFLSVLLVTCLHTPAAVASNSVYFSSNTMTIDETVLEAHTNVGAAPDVSLNAEQLAQTIYRIRQKYTVIAKAKNFKQVGLASWYGKKFHGRKTASGENMTCTN